MPGIRREQGLLGFVFAVLAVSTVAWAIADRTPQPWDPSDHVRTAYDFYRPLAHGQIAGFFREFFQTPHGYAPLFHLIAAGVFLVFGISRLTEIFPNILALAVLLCSVNWIGNRIYPRTGSSRPVLRPGFIAALLAACYHFPAWLMHDAFLDYMLTATVALAFAALLRADEFHVRSDAVLFGAIAGLGMWTKQTFLFFFIFPGVFLWIRALLRRDRRAIANLLLSAAIAVLIASIWYVPHIGDIAGIYRINALNAAVENDPSVFSLQSVAYYWAVLGNLQLQLPFTVLFIAGVACSVVRRRRQDWMLYLWVLSGILAFTCIANKDTRYTVPILPAVALLSVSWLDRIQPRFQSLAGPAIALWAFISFFNAQWPSADREIRGSVLGRPIYILAGNIARFDHQPLSEDWSIPRFVHAASGKLGVVPNLWQLNPSNVLLYARLNAPSVEVEWLTDDAAGNRVEECDYVLARTHLENADRAAPIEKAMELYLTENPGRFMPVAVYALPHAQEAVLFKRF